LARYAQVGFRDGLDDDIDEAIAEATDLDTFFAAVDRLHDARHNAWMAEYPG
jgi:hypothetical protein